MPVGRRMLVMHGLLMLSACATQSGRSQFVSLAPGDDAIKSLDAKEWERWKQERRTIDDPQMLQRVSNIGSRVVSASGLPTDGWDFTVFEGAEVYAFVILGGKVGIFTGLLDFVRSDDELAFVIAHEVSHIALRHRQEMLSQQIAIEMALAVARNIGTPTSEQSAPALALGARFGVELPFTRIQETEADKNGVSIMHKAGFDVWEAVSFWERLAGATDVVGPATTSDHPDNLQRAADLRAFIRKRKLSRH